MAAAQSAQTESNSASGALTALADKAASQRLGTINYGGEISPDDVYEFLKSNEGALVDVRTTPEWQFIGVADLTQTKGDMLTISWKNYPNFAINPQFANTLAASNVSAQTPLFFLCRSGGRSLDAAAAMTEIGYKYCFNVSGGFEGEPDGDGHRGQREGWKAAQLPWKQG